MTPSLAGTETNGRRAERGDDRRFALQVVRREPQAVIAFRAEYAHTLDAGFQALITTLAESDPPGCRSRMEALVPHVAGAVGEGFLKVLEERESSDVRLADPELSSHVPGLQMADLFHASACLAHDDAACRRLIRLVDDEIGPSLIRRFRQSLSPGRCEQIVQDVLSQVWSAPRAARSSAASDSAGPPCGARRLERFFGTSTLKTWLYSIGFRMLQDETRSQRTKERTIDGESTAFMPVAQESPPDEAAALRELTSRFKPRLMAVLSEALRALRRRPQPRLAQVAYLWLPCRVPQVEIADMFGVTKSSISQRVKEIIECLIAAASGVLEELSTATGLDPDRLQETLRMQLPAFFDAVLEQQWLSELRKLQSARPQLVQIGYLQWREQASAAVIADQLGEPPARVAVLIRQLEDWRRTAESRIAQTLNAESEVPVELLERAARWALAAGFARDLPATEASPGLQS